MKHKPLIWDHVEYPDSTFSFDGISLTIQLAGGSAMSTVLPISPVGYRDQNPTQSRVVRADKDGYARLAIYDDYAREYSLWIPMTMEQELQETMRRIAANKLT